MPAETPKLSFLNPTRRQLLAGAAAGAAGLMLPGGARANLPTAAVNTTGLAVTDTTVKVGILHSVTGTMAISETGSVQAEKLAIDQINKSGGILGRQIEIIQEDGASIGRPSPRSRRSSSSMTRSPPCSAAGPPPRARLSCRFSSNITACSTTRPSTRVSSSRRT